jgi:hypothetical protein
MEGGSTITSPKSQLSAHQIIHPRCTVSQIFLKYKKYLDVINIFLYKKNLNYVEVDLI